MPQAEQQARKRYTVLNTIESIRSQIDTAKELPQLPIVLLIRSEIGNEQTLNLFYTLLQPGEVEDELFALSERGQKVSLFIPHNDDEPASVFIPE